MLDNRTALNASRADFQQLGAHVSRTPELSGRRREQRLRQLYDPSYQPQRALAEGKFRTAGRTKQVRDQTKRRPGDVGEQQRRTAGRDDAPMNLGDFEVAIDGRVNGDDVAVGAKTVDERSEIWKQSNPSGRAGKTRPAVTTASACGT